MNATEKSKKAIADLIAEKKLPNAGVSRDLFLSVSMLVMNARTAEQMAFLAMSAAVDGRQECLEDFDYLLRESLHSVHSQLKFIGGLINGK